MGPLRRHRRELHGGCGGDVAGLVPQAHCRPAFAGTTIHFAARTQSCHAPSPLTALPAPATLAALPAGHPMFTVTSLWIPFTIIAALGQVARNAMQRSLTGPLGTWGAT